MTSDDILAAIEAENQRSTEAVRQVLLDHGRPDLVIELDANLREVRLGIKHARSVWHSISDAQRRVLLDLEARREPKVRTFATLRNLAHRGLIDLEGCMMPGDPVRLSEFGRFVLAKGR
jgi:hypothetical protein